MPYLLDGKCVYKKNADGSKGESRGCSETVELAKAHLRALYAHEKTKERLDALYPIQSLATKFPQLKEKDAFAVASATWDVESAAQVLVQLAALTRSEASQQETEDANELAAIMRALVDYVRGEVYEIETANNLPSQDYSMYKEAPSSFLVEKDAKGNYRWILFTSSAFEDRDGEIVSKAALERDCDEMELTKEYGELLWYHCDGELHKGEKEARPYIPLGSCDFSFVNDKINIESGNFYDQRVAKAFAEKAEQLRASKSFYYPPGEFRDGIYYRIRTKERSAMFAGKESNLLTRAMFWQKEKAMADNQDRINAFKKLVGEDTAKDVLAQAKELSARADQVLRSKEADLKAEDDTDETKKKKEDVPVKEEKTTDDTILAVAVKEIKDGFAASLKEAMEPLAANLKAETEKANGRMDKLESALVEQNKALAALMGIQPKKFQASKEGKPVNQADVEKMTADYKAKLADAEKNFDNGTGFLEFVMEQSFGTPQ